MARQVRYETQLLDGQYTVWCRWEHGAETYVGAARGLKVDAEALRVEARANLEREITDAIGAGMLVSPR